MSGGVVDGQAVDAAVTNPAFLIKNADDSTLFKLGLQRSAGGLLTFTDAQLAISTIMGAGGLTGQSDTTGNTYSSNIIINNGDTWKAALGKLDAAFNASNKKAVISIADNNSNSASGAILIVPGTSMDTSMNSLTGVMTVSARGWPVTNFPQQNLVDNQSSATIITAFDVSLNAQVYLDFVMSRAAGQIRAGRLTLTNDGSGSANTSILNEDWEETADCGVTFSTTVETVASVVSMTLKYTSTSTGTAPKFLAKITNKSYPT